MNPNTTRTTQRNAQRRTHRFAAAALGVGLAFSAAACSDDDDDADSTSASNTTLAVETTTADTAVTPTEDTLTEDTSTGDSSTGDTTIDERLDAAADALRDGDFSTMLQLLSLSGLADELEGRSVTILAPTEAAFDQLTRGELGDLITNPSQIDDVLRRHVIDGALTYEELSELTEVETVSGDVLMVSFENGELTVDGTVVNEPENESVSGEAGQEVSVLGIEQVLLEG